MRLFIFYMSESPAYYFSWVFSVMFSICVHEYAHAAMALHHGDDTASQRGHLTLNPLVQMGIRSLILLFVIGIAWGSVPVNLAKLRTRRSAAAVAFAGPLANLFLCVIFGFRGN